MSERLFGRLLSLPKPGLRPGLAAGTAARSRLGMRRRGGRDVGRPQAAPRRVAGPARSKLRLLDVAPAAQGPIGPCAAPP